MPFSHGRLAVLGWGSLLWDLDDLAPRVDGDWLIGAGPVLALEFSRVSAKRRGALTLVIDAEAGAPCPTHAIASRTGDIHAAVGDLAARERCSRGRIGAVCLASGHRAGHDPAVVEQVAAWCAAAGWRGAVWTDLLPNFAEAWAQPFSVPAGMAYLEGLRGAARAEAVRYIALAPPETDTGLRRALEAQAWWRAARAEIGV